MCKLSEFKFSSTNIKGKEYVEVNERLKAFRTCEEFVGYTMESSVLKFDGNSILIKASIKNDKGIIVAEGLALEEKEGSVINKTSFVENAETSAWGRALGCLGIGIDKAVASKDEVQNAISRQQSIQSSTQIRSINNQPQSGVIQNPVTQPQQQSQYPATKTITVNGYTVDYKLGFSKKNNEYYYVLVDLNAQSIGANKYLKVGE